MLGLLVLAVVYGLGRLDSTSRADDETLTTAALNWHQANAQFLARLETSRTEALGLRRAAQNARSQRERLQGRADSLAHLTDSLVLTLQPLATSSDSASFWHSRFLDRTAEVRELRIALGTAAQELVATERDRDLGWAAADSAHTLLVRADSLVKAEERRRVCKLIFGVRCPSRITSVAVGLLGGFVLGVIAH